MGLRRKHIAEFCPETLSINLYKPADSILDEIGSHELYHYLFTVSSVAGLSIIDKWYGFLLNLKEFIRDFDGKKAHIGLPLKSWLNCPKNEKIAGDINSIMNNVSSDKNFVFGKYDPLELIKNDNNLICKKDAFSFEINVEYSDQFETEYPFLNLNGKDTEAKIPIGMQLIQENLIHILEQSEFNATPIKREFNEYKSFENNILNLAIVDLLKRQGSKKVDYSTIIVMYIVAIYLNPAIYNQYPYQITNNEIMTPGEILLEEIKALGEIEPCKENEEPIEFANRITKKLIDIEFDELLEFSMTYLYSKYKAFKCNDNLIVPFLAKHGTKVCLYYADNPNTIFTFPMKVISESFFAMPLIRHPGNGLGYNEKFLEKNEPLYAYFAESQIYLNLLQNKKFYCPFLQNLDCTERSSCIAYLKDDSNNEPYFPDCPQIEFYESIIGNLDKFYTMA